MKRKENFQWLPKELHQLKYEAISVPQGSVRLVKKTQERKSSTCYLLITKGVTSSSPVPLKTRRERERGEQIDEVDISTPVAVDQRVANCLEEALRSFTTMWNRYRSSRFDIFRRPLQVFRVVRCSSVHCFETRISVELSAAHELLLRDMKILILKGG
ncbi:uncharacterized protein TNCV_2667161 [Trichonephila clavipes]|nr:uncharacterized protein TNCV_2667161 [Trichonephila clavipes]